MELSLREEKMEAEKRREEGGEARFKLGGFEFFEKVLKSPKFIAAPMVGEIRVVHSVLEGGSK
jgi:hypothetical protein